MKNIKEDVEERNEALDKEAKKHLDAAMKAVGHDLKLAAWIAWANGLLFEEKSREEMRAFVKRARIEELKKYFKPLPVSIRDEKKRGVILDIFYAVIRDGETIAYINIENEISLYSFERIATRSRVYICSSVFWQKINVFGPSYENLKEVVATWIFPKFETQYLKNTIEFDTILFSSFPFRLDGKTGKRSSETNLNLDLEMPLRFYYLGSPLEVFLEEGEDSFDFKHLNLLKIFDALFYAGREVSIEKREEIVAFYGLNRELVSTTMEETEKAMNILEAYAQPLREELEEKDKTIRLISREKDIISREKDIISREKDTISRESKEKDIKIDLISRENEEKDKKIDLISREVIQLKEENKAQQKKYEKIVRMLKEKLAGSNNKD